jgi:hypothetical protein
MSFAVFCSRASLHFVPENQNRVIWEQLRTNLHRTQSKPGSSGTPSLRRKEESFVLCGTAEAVP